MMSKHIPVILVIVVLNLIEFATPYTLAYGKVINFPRQRALAGGAFDFVRVREQQDDEGRWRVAHQLLACPAAYVFDAAQMKCVRTVRTAGGNQNRRQHQHQHQTHRNLRGASTAAQAASIDMCPMDAVVLLPHPLDCRRFLNCYHGQAHVQGCPDGLTFDNSTKQCNWPEEANCCEYL